MMKLVHHNKIISIGYPIPTDAEETYRPTRHHRKHILDDPPHMIDPSNYFVLFVKTIPCGHMNFYVS